MAQLMLINPRKRRATKRKTATSRKRRTYKRASAAPATSIVRRRRSALRGVARRSRRVRRNPIGVNGIVGMVTDAGIGAAGAIGVDLLFNALPLPVSLKAGHAGTAAKAATAILVGTVGKKVLGRTAEKLAAGALVVQAYQLLQSFMPISAPSLGFVNAGMNAGYMPQSTMGMELDGLGEYVGQPAYSYNGSSMGEYVQ